MKITIKSNLPAFKKELLDIDSVIKNLNKIETLEEQISKLKKITEINTIRSLTRRRTFYKVMYSFLVQAKEEYNTGRKEACKFSIE